MAAIARARLLALALCASLALPALTAITVGPAAPAAATDAPPRSPDGTALAPLTPSATAAATARETARVVLSEAPRLTPATTASVTGTLRVHDLDGSGPFAAQRQSVVDYVSKNLDPESSQTLEGGLRFRGERFRVFLPV